MRVPADPLVFTAPGAWTGADYELALELGPRDDVQLGAALAALWTVSCLDGCYRDPNAEPAGQLREAPDLATHCWHGVATSSGGARVACRSLVVRFDGGGPDVLSLGLPMGSLAHARLVGS